MRCPDCHAEYTANDMYCRRCGSDLPRPSTSIVTTQSNLPAVLYNPQLPKSVAAGVGALALGVGIELLRRNLLGRLKATVTRQPVPVLNGVKDILFPQQKKPMKLPKGYEVEETVWYVRRVIRREH